MTVKKSPSKAAKTQRIVQSAPKKGKISRSAIKKAVLKVIAARSK